MIKVVGGQDVTIAAGSSLNRTVHYFVDSEICDANWKQCYPQEYGVTFEEVEGNLMVGDRIEVEFHVQFLVERYKKAACYFIFGQRMITKFVEDYALATDCKYGEVVTSNMRVKSRGRLDIGKAKTAS